MKNLVNIEYASSGAASTENPMGMREMQARVYALRHEQYILLKAPPASGKSRALMFLGLDKLKQGTVKKIIVAVPERSIGKSFGTTQLSINGFHSDWILLPHNDLCLAGSDSGKVKKLRAFLESSDTILVCTHATFRFAFEEMGASSFKDCLIAIDEFHHVSSDRDNKLGEKVKALIELKSPHIIAMTGSYFRGDGVSVLAPEDEAVFSKMSYNYYEQLNGYKYLKSLGIDFHFYTGKYTDAISEVLDTNKKTIIHIPSVNSGESTKDKYLEVDSIIDAIGITESCDEDTGILYIRRHLDGKIIKLADLVNDAPKEREKVVSYLRDIKSPDDLDIIIALGMAKEGFDWTYCEHALTIGYRGSLTEIIQIIGRCTRDCFGKHHAQFTNLIAAPDAENEDITDATNNLLKAISASLLMEQVLAPKFDFNDAKQRGVEIKGYKKPTSDKVKQILETDLTDIEAAILQNPAIMLAYASQEVDNKFVSRKLIPKILIEKYPDLSVDEIEQLRQGVAVDMFSHKIKEVSNTKFIDGSSRFLNMSEIDMDLIDQINPFQDSISILSKSLTPDILRQIQECIEAHKIDMTIEEAHFMMQEINDFVRTHGVEPRLNSLNPREKRLAQALACARVYVRNHRNQ